jgi:hypothetical protein
VQTRRTTPSYYLGSVGSGGCGRRLRIIVCNVIGTGNRAVTGRGKFDCRVSLSRGEGLTKRWARTAFHRRSMTNLGTPPDIDKSVGSSAPSSSTLGLTAEIKAIVACRVYNVVRMSELQQVLSTWRVMITTSSIRSSIREGL